MYNGYVANIANTLEEEDVNKSKYLTFWTDNQLFGISIEDVIQIIGVQEITKVPEFPSYAKGIINLRGSIIPVVDVRLRFHKEEKAYDERTCIIITNVNSISVGFIVDSVDEVATINEQDMAPPPKLSSKDNTNAYILGVGKLDKKVILLIDTEKILSEETLIAISQEML